VPAGSGGGLWSTIIAIFSWRFMQGVAALVLVLFAAGLLVWLFERRRNPEQFGGSGGRGLAAGFWWSAVTMTTVGYGDKAPVTLGGRLIGLVWMFAGLIMVSTFTAAVTSALTVGNLQGGIQGPEDLRRAHVATIEGTISARYLDSLRIRRSDYSGLLEAMRAVQQGEADAVVYDLPIMQYRNGELGEGGLRMLAGTFENQSYAFALANGSPYRERLSQEVLRITNGADWNKVLELYLGRP
jgi:hypothetical protein